MKNGMIVFIEGEPTSGNKLLEIKITNTFPLIVLDKKAFWYKANGEKEDISHFNHISIPPDLRVHLSDSSGIENSRFLNVERIWKLIDENSTDLEHCFTFIESPYKHTGLLVEPGKTKKWEGESEIISLFQFKNFNENTRFFVDFFLHNKLIPKERINNYKFCLPNMRLTSEKGINYLVGPYSFSDLQRREGCNNNLMFTIRFGYVEMEDNTNSVYFYSPLPEFNF